MNRPENPQDMTSNKPYLIRAIYEWIADNQMIPHLLVDVTKKNVRVPMHYAKDGQIVLNVSAGATIGLEMGNDYINFRARFSGILTEVWLPVNSILGIYARENGIGMFFEPEPEPEEEGHDEEGNSSKAPASSRKKPGKPKLTLVKS